MKSKKNRLVLKFTILLAAFCLIFSGVYMLLLVNSPRISFPFESDAASFNIPVIPSGTEMQNTIFIPKIGLKVAFFEGDKSVLNKGTWHRYPERGNPEIGGNFILSAHRFNLGLTIAKTRKKSPFYNLDELEISDEIFIYYDNRMYHYSVTDKYKVAPNQVEIERPSSDPKLTLYTCTLKGTYDGRLVVEAEPDKI